MTRRSGFAALFVIFGLVPGMSEGRAQPPARQRASTTQDLPFAPSIRAATTSGFSGKAPTAGLTGRLARLPTR